MTRGTVHQYDPERGTGVLCCIAGTHVPFSSRNPHLRAGDDVTFTLTGGIAGLYAYDVAHPSPAQRQTVPSVLGREVFPGAFAPAAG